VSGIYIVNVTSSLTYASSYTRQTMVKLDDKNAVCCATCTCRESWWLFGVEA